MHQLRFYPTTATPSDPTFRAYVEALDKKEFHHERNGEQVIKAVAEYLFKDPMAIHRVNKKK